MLEDFILTETWHKLCRCWRCKRNKAETSCAGFSGVWQGGGKMHLNESHLIHSQLPGMQEKTRRPWNPIQTRLVRLFWAHLKMSHVLNWVDRTPKKSSPQILHTSQQSTCFRWKKWNETCKKTISFELVTIHSFTVGLFLWWSVAKEEHATQDLKTPKEDVITETYVVGWKCHVKPADGACATVEGQRQKANTPAMDRCDSYFWSTGDAKASVLSPALVHVPVISCHLILNAFEARESVHEFQ